MRHSSFLLLLLSFSLSTRLLAQNNEAAHAAQNDQSQQDSIGATLTLPQAIAIATRNNLAIAQAGLTSQGQKINYDQAWEYMLPTFSGSGGQQLNFGRTINSSTSNSFVTSQFNSGNAGLSGGLTLFHGLELQNLLKENRYAYHASQMDLQWQKDQITLAVLLDYLQVLSSRDQLRLAYEQATVDSISLIRLEAQGREGALNPVSNLTDLRGQYAQDQINIATAVNNLETAKVAVFSLLNVNYRREVEYQNSVTATDISAYQATSDSIFQHALEIIPAIKSAQLKVYEFDRALAYYRGAYWPTVTFNGGVSTNWTNVPANTSFVTTGAPTYTETGVYYTDPNGVNPVYQQNATGYPVYPKFGDQFKNNRSEYLGINVSIPILNGFQARNNVRQAKLTLKNYQLQNTNTRYALQQTIEVAFQNMIAAYKTYKFYQEQAVAYEESFRITNIRFTEGVVTSDVYILAKGHSDQAEVNLAAAKYIYIFRTKVLDYYQGKFTLQ
jgi:outer membrane protein